MNIPGYISEYCLKIDKIEQNPYFIKLLNKPCLNSFLKSQECFIDAIDHWSRILGLLVFNLPSDKERLAIIQNLYDEHGNGDINSSHVNTFKKLLVSLNYESEIRFRDKSLTTYWKINDFNEKLTTMVLKESWVVSVAALGMIEYTYSQISGFMHRYIRNFLNPELINHYGIHEKLDQYHAKGFFDLISDQNNYDIKKGLDLGYNLLYQLYERLSNELEFLPTTTSE